MKRTAAPHLGLLSRRKNTAGVTLLELLLSTAIMMIMMGGLLAVTDAWTQRTINRQAGIDVLQVQSGMEAYIAANYADVCATEDGKFHAPYANTTQALNDLKSNGFLSPRSQGRTAQGQGLRILVACNAEDATSNPPRAAYAEVVVLTTGEVVSDHDVKDSALAIGPRLGTYSTLNGASPAIISATGSWNIDTARLQGLSVATPNADGGYLVSYGRISSGGAVNSDYLYKTKVAGRGDLNAMQTALNMNNNSVSDVGVLQTSALRVGGNATVGTAQTADATGQVPTALSVDDYLDAQGADTVKVGALSVSGGSTQTSNLNAASSALASSNGVMTISGTGGNGLTVDSGDAANIASVQFKNMSAENGIRLTGDMLVSGDTTIKDQGTGAGPQTATFAGMQAGTTNLTATTPIEARQVVAVTATGGDLLNAGSLAVAKNAGGSTTLAVNTLESGDTAVSGTTTVRAIACANGGTPPQCILPSVAMPAARYTYDTEQKKDYVRRRKGHH